MHAHTRTQTHKFHKWFPLIRIVSEQKHLQRQMTTPSKDNVALMLRKIKVLWLDLMKVVKLCYKYNITIIGGKLSDDTYERL